MITAKKLRVALLAGGLSAEREVSLKSAKEIKTALDSVSRYSVTLYDPKKDLKRFFRDALAKKIDVVFFGLHGGGGENGEWQGVCETLQLPYTGSGVLASATAMNKVVTKRLFQQARLPVAKDIVLSRSDFFGKNTNILRRKIASLGDIVVKPISDGSSVDTFVKPKAKSLISLLKALLTKYNELLIEQYIEGRELTVGVLGNQALPVVEIQSKHGWFNYEAKYLDADTTEICPAPLNSKQTKEAQKLALQAHAVLGCYGYSRTDMILHPKKGLILLETNSLPGMTKTSLIPKEAKAAGMPFVQVLESIIDSALNR